MTTLQLEYSQILQGAFTPKRRNLLFVFQVNCPGCFYYGFPMVNALYRQHGGQVGFLGLSTAFEDFDLNTLKNTEKLLTEKKLVGATKDAFTENSGDTYPDDIDFPIAMDALSDPSSFIGPENLDHIGNRFKNYQEASQIQRQRFQDEIRAYLSTFPRIPVTFTMNQFRGTPTFVLFDDTMTILEHWFGHRSVEEIQDKINKWLN